MHPYATIVLQHYYRAIGWNEDNLYSSLTRASQAILDFSVPRGVQFHISKAPNNVFNTTYSLNALPALNGSIGYIHTTCNLGMRASGDSRLKDVVERFRVYDVPRRPEGKEEQWLAGERVDSRDYLMYGRYYIPSSRLDALYTTRLSSTTQALVSIISDASAGPLYTRPSKGGIGLSGANNLMLNLQHDTGTWSTEYSWSADDGMWGARVLRNFGISESAPGAPNSFLSYNAGEEKRVDEEEAMEGGLRGRFSAGAEAYVSLREKSAGLSTGFRFTTLPEHKTQTAANGAYSEPELSQPPTTLTALFNPMMGHISTAYAAKVSRDLALCSRFDFNVYSYESEWTVGAEWWMRKSLAEESDDGSCNPSSNTHSAMKSTKPAKQPFDNIQGVVKARVSTTSNVSVLWEGRIGQALISLGVMSDFSNRLKPIRSMGLELAYFSTD